MRRGKPGWPQGEGAPLRHSAAAVEPPLWWHLLEIGWRSLIAMVILTALVVGLLTLLDQQRFAAQRTATLADEVNRLEAVATLLSGDLDWVIGRSRILAESSTLKDYLDQPSTPGLLRLQSEITSLALHSGLYHDIWLTDRSGDVELHIAYDDGQSRPVAGQETPPHIRRAVAELQTRDIYISPLQRHGDDEALTILIALRATDSANRPRGAVIASFAADILLQRLRLASAGERSHIFIANNDGSVLALPAPDSASAIRLFERQRDSLWPLIAAQNAGITYGDEVFAFATLAVTGQPYRAWQPHSMAGATPLREWKLIGLLPPALYQYQPLRTFDLAPGIGVGIIALMGAVSIALGWLRTSNVEQAQTLELNEERLALALEGADEGLFDIDVTRDRMIVSDRVAQLLGYPPAMQLRASQWLEWIHPEDRSKARLAGRAAFTTPSHHFNVRYRIRRHDGQYLWLQARGRALTDAYGQPLRVVGTVTDASADVATEEKLRQAAVVFESTAEAIVVLDAKGRVVAVNSAFEDITGFSREEALGLGRQTLLADPSHASVFQEVDAALAESGHWRGELQARRKSGEVFPLLVNVSAIRSPYSNEREYVAVLTDISLFKSSQERLDHLAHHDALTGLPNRLLFNATLEQALHRSERHKQRVGLLFLDLDRFKHVNDTLGHAIGDKLLQAVAQRLRQCVRHEDTVARLGGDEFTVILEELEDARAAAAPAEKIIEALARPVELDGHVVTTSTSLGISIYPDDADCADALIKAADAAMYRAKQLGRNNFQFYTSKLTDQANRRLRIEEGLRSALAEERLTVLYQPQVMLPELQISGAEALLRWNHPEHGLLPASEFLPVAEDSGLIQPLGDWLLATVCRQAKSWHDQGMPTVRLGVNVSTRQLGGRQALERMQRIVRSLQLEPGVLRLDLEIAGGGLSYIENNLDALKELSELGVGLAVDNFGAGQMSLHALAKLPIDLIKIDRSLTRRLNEGRSRAIVRATVALCRSLKLPVLGQAVEKPGELAFLRLAGCTEAQGYLFSKPLTAREFGDLLRQPDRHLRPLPM